jgi:hypothetical protein
VPPVFVFLALLTVWVNSPHMSTAHIELRDREELVTAGAGHLIPLDHLCTEQTSVVSQGAGQRPRFTEPGVESGTGYAE